MRATGRTPAGLPWLRDQVRALFDPPVAALRGRRWDRLWLGPALSVVVVVLALAFRTRSGHAFLAEYAITRPGDAVHLTLMKLPLSMFAPAALLPFWFAVLQVGVVYSLAQTLVGAWRTLLVAICGHGLATFGDTVWVWLGPPLGVGRRYLDFGSAGPSVAVITLLAYLAVVRRVWWLAVAILVYHAVELSIFNGLSQRDHVVGTLTGIALAVGTRLLERGRRRRRVRPVEP